MRATPILFGVVAGLLAGAVQILGFYPPAAYGVCVVCHARDLVNSLGRWLFDVPLGTAAIAQVFPPLVTVGLVLAAFWAARRAGEWQWRRAESAPKAFLLGLLVMFSGLLAAACPLRLFLRTAYGDLAAVLGVLAMLAGIAISNEFLTRGVGR